MRALGQKGGQSEDSTVGSWRVLARFLAGRSLIGKPQIDDGLAQVDLRRRASHSHSHTDHIPSHKPCKP